jgi:hypothetical protein
MKENLIKEILCKEWKMFISVKNQGGKASCQEDQKTFMIMRSSQFQTFPVEVLESYLSDLLHAGRYNRNLMTEKYGWMMEYTSPAEFKLIKDLLPRKDLTSLKYIKKILPILLEWEKDLYIKFPYIYSLGRPTLTTEDKPFLTSFETYTKGELCTYSPHTLLLYYNFIKEIYNKKINQSELILLNMVKKYGYSSLIEANESIKRKTNKE